MPLNLIFYSGQIESVRLGLIKNYITCFSHITPEKPEAELRDEVKGLEAERRPDRSQHRLVFAVEDGQDKDGLTEEIALNKIITPKLFLVQRELPYRVIIVSKNLVANCLAQTSLVSETEGACERAKAQK